MECPPIDAAVAKHHGTERRYIVADKAMANKRVLTYHAARKCFKKTKFGRTFYLALGLCPNKSDADGYRKALAEWRVIEARLLVEKEMERIGSFHDARYKTQTLVDRECGPFERPHIERDTGVNRSQPTLNGDSGNGRSAMSRYSARHGVTVAAAGSGGQVTIAAAAAEYKRRRRQRVELGELSISAFDETVCKLDDFLTFLRGSGIRAEYVSELTTGVFDAYRQAQLGFLTTSDTDDQLSPSTIRKRLRTAVAFAQFLWQQDWLERLPRVLRTREYTRVEYPRPELQHFTVGECRRLVASADDLTAACILLGLNCGYVQVDVGLLTHDMIDWEAGVISRTRQKTARKAEVPQEHALWEITKDYLRRCMTNPSRCESVLVNRLGNPLLSERLNDKDRRSRNDSIRKRFDTAVANAGIDANGRTFKTLRATGAEGMAQQCQDRPHLVSYFLAHSEKETRVHYVDRPFDEHHKELRRLEGYFFPAGWRESIPQAVDREGTTVQTPTIPNDGDKTVREAA